MTEPDEDLTAEKAVAEIRKAREANTPPGGIKLPPLPPPPAPPCKVTVHDHVIDLSDSNELTSENVKAALRATSEAAARNVAQTQAMLDSTSSGRVRLPSKKRRK